MSQEARRGHSYDMLVVVSRWVLAVLVGGLGPLAAPAASSSSAEEQAAIPRSSSKPRAGLPGGLLVLSCSGCPGSPAGSSLFTLTPRGRLHALPGTEGAYYPAWSPDRRLVVFSLRFRELWIVAAEGSGSHRLTEAAGDNHDTGPAWSPGGHTIVFMRAAPAPTGAYRTSLWKIPAAGGTARPVYEGPSSVHNPSWSPDGRRIAFIDAAQRMWTVRPDGSRRQRLGRATLRGTAPRWSPEGKRVAFLEYGKVAALSVLDVATGRVRRIVRFGSSSSLLREHAWSPDGRWLALARVREYACDEVPAPDRCSVFEVLAVRVHDGTKRLIYTADYGEPYGLDWRR